MNAKEEDKANPAQSKQLTGVGYKRPPIKNRFKPGQSGNPSGRTKGSKNLKTLFQKILREEVSLREGQDVKKISKAEAVVRGVVVGALRGDARSLAILFRLAEQAGEFEEASDKITRIERVIVSWKPTDSAPVPVNSEISKDDQ
jgi:hypothetical protein